MTTLVVLVLGAAAVLGAVGLMRGWRSPIGSDHFRVPAYWPWGDAAWYGFRRTDLVGEVFIVIIAASFAFPRYVAYWSIPVLLLIVLGVAIVLFNWPRILVPHALRDQRGFLASIRRRSEA